MNERRKPEFPRLLEVSQSLPRVDMIKRYHKEDAIAPISYRQTKEAVLNRNIFLKNDR